jgi:hypothetical protein
MFIKRLSENEQKMCSIIFLSFLIIATIDQSGKSQSIKSFTASKEVISNINAAEKKLKNIKIDSEIWIERKKDLDDPCELWERTPIYVSSTSWFNGLPGSKARVDVHKEVLEWQEGLAPYVERSYTISFDGQYGQEINHSMKYDETTILDKTGRYMSGIPNKLIAGWVDVFTGNVFSLNYSINQRGYAFSQIMQKSSEDPNFKRDNDFEFVTEEKNSISYLRINSGKPKIGKTFHTYLLDLSHNFALIESKRIAVNDDGSNRLISSVETTKLEKYNDDIWWPKEGYFIRPSGNKEKPYERVVYRASTIIINDPNFDNNIYSVHFPKGYRINDEVNHINYRVEN